MGEPLQVDTASLAEPIPTLSASPALTGSDPVSQAIAAQAAKTDAALAAIKHEVAEHAQNVSTAARGYDRSDRDIADTMSKHTFGGTEVQQAGHGFKQGGGRRWGEGVAVSEDDEPATCSRIPRPRTMRPLFAFPTVGIYFSGLVVFAVSTMAVVAGWAPVWVTIAANAGVSYVMFTVVHEAVHHSISTAGWVNALFGRLAWVFVSPMSSFPSLASIHMAHHRYTNDRTMDPDASATHVKWWQLPFRWALVDAFYVMYYTRRLPSRPARELAETAVMFSLCAAVVAGAGVSGNLWMLAVVVVIPQRVAIFVLAWAFDWLPHHRLRDTPDTNRYRTTWARAGMEWLLTPLLLSQNYHLVHHLHPWVPWYRYLPTWRENEKIYLRSQVPLISAFGRLLTPDEFGKGKRLNASRKIGK
ncbi:fatty acid desaturase [Candidatus Mycobacterium methanotrophicum]|uniref:Fatty acid desaturase n=1 Tax=Candidatus Mycobacterium methanotrophicum TaxID=2943498 RepID=A0ABY4QPS1_9MYCO|nr:fatty acid desaturase [Candidatus Mycobacterium methanotrophicum]UQX12619.1 fatty acid desaturase [Candidatus Mycobacterium methanotrophicum]